MSPLLTTADVMRLFGFASRTSLYKAIHRGDIPEPRKIGSRNRWLHSDIEGATAKLPCPTSAPVRQI